MAKKDRIIGKIIEELPNLQYRVEIEGGIIIRCYTAGKLKIANIRLIVGDMVEINYDPSQGGKIGRIVWRK